MAPPKSGASTGTPRSTAAQGSLAQRIVEAPQPSAPQAARARVRDWLAGAAGDAAGPALAALTAQPNVAALTEGIADDSPYLWDLITASPARWLALLQSDPGERLAALLAEAEKEPEVTADDDALMRHLRRIKAEAALLIATADAGGVWDLGEVTHALTAVADAAVGAAVRHLLRGARRDGWMRAGDPENPAAGSGYAVLALGKMGARELNYSSDVDLMVFFDPAARRLAPGIEPGQAFVRMTRSLIRLLQERTADGYVFRVDLRLRPDPASTQVAISTEAALHYYERSGQNWERAALIKARPCAGDLAAGEALLKELSPFVWRKYLDFAALADVHAMKREIHVYRGHGDIAVEGHNIKLGRGGIREIEFFVQTQQLIAGGRHPELRGRATLAMLAQLARDGWIREEARAELDGAYRFLRRIEHRLQMVADQQTHTLPADADELERFARFAGFDSRNAFADALLTHLHAVQRHYAALFEGRPALDAAPVFDLSTDSGLRDTVRALSAHGFSRPADAAATMRGWLAGGYRSLRGETARRHLAELLPVIVAHLGRAGDPDAALAALDRFLQGLRGGARFYSLLRQNPDVLALLATILSTAPRLAEILAQQSDVIGAVLEPAFFGALPDEGRLTQALWASLDQAASFEDVLDRARLFGREHMFLIGVRVISGTVTAEQAGDAFARLADILIRAMLRAVEARFVAEHGRLRGQETAVLALGKLGGREMTAGSDLDLILIYDFDRRRPNSDGPRPLHGGQYVARLTQRLINALTVPTNYGKLYDVDMRLRPSGRSGPLATSFEAFKHYQENEAWTWEHMALTRARLVSASPAFAARVEKLASAILQRPRDARRVAADTLEMRHAIAVERGDGDRWNIKYARGGLLDIEFVAQYLQLAHAAAHPEILDPSTARVLDNAAGLGVLAAEDAEVLRPAARLYHDLTQLLRLCVSGPFEPAAAGPRLLQLLAGAADVPDFPTLEAHLAETQQRVRASFNRILAAGRP